MAIEQANPYAHDVRRRFFALAVRLDESLSPPSENAPPAILSNGQ